MSTIINKHPHKIFTRYSRVEEFLRSIELDDDWTYKPVMKRTPRNDNAKTWIIEIYDEDGFKLGLL